MNKQRKVLITITYNEMGIIIDTKAEEVAQPERTQERTETHSCDLISRAAAIEELRRAEALVRAFGYSYVFDAIREMPAAQSEEDCDTCKHGYFGNAQCEICRMRYPSHYERRTDERSD